jgi:hypothetical protein
MQMRKTKFTLTLMTLVGLVLLAGYLSGGSSAAAGSRVNPDYRGASTFSVVGAGPNVARCGAFPENVEIQLTGSGIDTEGGYNTAVTSFCTNTVTNLVFDLKAIDTYQSGDQVFIEADPFVQVVNPATCVASNAQAVGFRVAGGTGGHAGATGHGRFHIANNLTPCNGLTIPSAVWFEGVIMLP